MIVLPAGTRSLTLERSRFADQEAGLKEVFVDWSPVDVDTDAGRLITDAESRISRILLEVPRISGFEASNFYVAAGVLSTLKENTMLHGLRLCEWGIGFGVLTCLAAQFGYQACGIELEPVLVHAARRLAADHALDCDFFLGTYVPEGAWKGDAQAEELDKSLGFSPFDFDLVYAYPWPAEADLLDQLFCRYAPPGALLVSYQGGGRIKLQLKC